MAGFVVDNRGIVRVVSDYFKERVRSNFLWGDASNSP